MNNRQRFSYDCKGFSLIELIVSILIMSVISAMVVMLISSSRATYSEVKTDAVLQGEAETVRKFINELALEASAWGEKSDFTHAGKTYKFIWVKAPNNDQKGLADRSTYYYVFLHRAEDNLLMYGKYLYDDLLAGGELFGTGFEFKNELYSNNIISSPYAVLAEHVQAIDLDETSANLIAISVDFSYNDHPYSITVNCAGRNSEITELFPD